uniref:E3 ubiquitin-protein ligase RBBP6 n=1 Tax=Dicentrarchus labrax TaxID=13489 RepID=A0A8C4IS00_DICLA
MSCVHYKFSSKLDYNTVTFDGLHITLSELKRQIMGRERLKATDCDLQITNAQTREEYTDDEAHIPKHSSVIVRRTPIGGVKPAGRTFIVDRSDTAVVGSSRPTDSSPSMSLAQLAKTANLVDANASEEDKIKAMMSQSNHEYDPIHYSKKAVGPPPAHYTCYRCGKAGHYIRQCPLLMVQDKSVEGPKQVRISKGIPQSFMVKAEPGTKGAMLTSTGEYAIPAIDAEAYAQGKKERPPFVPHDQSSSEDDSDPIPDELLCPICNDLMTDAVVIPCCGNSYCDDCIRTTLLDSEEHICFTCKQSDVSPDNLIANKFLRQAVNNFKNETGYTKHVRKQLQNAAPPPPRPQLLRPLHSRQQDPLLANVTHPSTSAPSTAPPAQAPPPAPVASAAATTAAPAAPSAPTPPHAAVEGQDVSPAPPPVVDHHSPMRSTSQGEPPPPGESDPEPTVTPDSSGTPESGSQNYHLSIVGHPPPVRPPHPSGHQSRPHHSHRGGGRHWERSFRGRGEHPSPHLQTAPPPAPVPPVFPAPSLYPPPLQPYPPPYTSGPSLIPPPAISYQPQPVYAPGPPVLNPPWVAPGAQPPLLPLPPSLSQPPLSKEDFYRQRHHRQDNVTSKLDEFTKDFHKELMKYRNAPKRRRPSYSRSRSRSRSRSYSYSPSRSRSRSRSHGRSYPRSPYSRRNGRSYGRSRTRSRSRSRSYGYRRSGSPRSPPPLRGGGGWEGPEGAGPYRSRSRSRSPGGFRSRSPGGRKPPPRELAPYELKGPSPGGHDRWERERYRQWEKEYADWYNKYYKDYDNQHPSLHHRGRGSRDRERDRMSPLSRDYSPQGRGRRGRDERGAPPHHPPSSSSSGTKSSAKVLKTKKVKKKKTGEDSETSHQSVDRGDATPVRDEPMDEIPSLIKTPPISSKPPVGTATTKAPASKSPAAPVKPSTKSTSKTQSDKAKKDSKGQKVKAKVKTEGTKAKSDKVKKKTAEVVVTKKKDSSSSSSSSVAKPIKTSKAKPEDASNSTTPKKEKGKSSAVRPPLLKTPLLSPQSLPLHHPSLHDGPRPGHDIRGRRDLPQSSGLLPIPHQHILPLLHRPASPVDSRRRMGEEGRSLLGPPPGKLRRIDGLGVGGDVISHSHMSHQPPLHRLPPSSDRPGLLPLPGSREMGRGDTDRGSIRSLRELQVPLPQRSIKLNRDLGRRGSTETATSDRALSGSEKTTSTSDRTAAANISEGDRPSSTAEGAGRKERSASAERGVSRERPGSAGERLQGSDREQSRSSGVDRERDRASGSDRDRVDRDRVSGSDRDRVDRDRVSGSDRDRVDRDRVSGSDRDRVDRDRVDRERVSGSDRDRVDRDRVSGSDRDRVDRDRVSGSDRDKVSGSDRDRASGSDRDRGTASDRERDRVSGSGSQKVAVTVERDAEGERSMRTERKNSGGGSAGGRSVSLDKMTIGEKSAITKKVVDHQEKPSISSKEKGEGSERAAKSDRSVSKDRTERTVPSGEKPAAAHKEVKDGAESVVKNRPRINRKALTSPNLGSTSSRSTQETKRDSDKDQKSVSSKSAEPQSSPVNSHGRSPSISPAPSPAREEPLIQPPPRSKWEREDDEEGQENGLSAPKEPSPVPQRGRGREVQNEAPKAVRNEGRDGTREERKGVVREEKKGRAPREEGKGGRAAQINSDKPTKTKTVREEGRAAAREEGRGGREEGRGVTGKEERAGGGGGREESRGPEPRRQRLCSDLGRETDEADWNRWYLAGTYSKPVGSRRVIYCTHPSYLAL